MARNGMDDLLGPPSTAQQYGQQQYVPNEYYAPPAVDPGKTVDLSGGGGGFATPQPGPSFRPSGPSSLNGTSSSTGFGPRGPSSFEGGAGPTLSLASLSPQAIMQQLTSRPLTEVVAENGRALMQVPRYLARAYSSAARRYLRPWNEFARLNPQRVVEGVRQASRRGEIQVYLQRNVIANARHFCPNYAFIFLAMLFMFVCTSPMLLMMLAGVGGGWSHAMRSDQFRNRPWTLQIGKTEKCRLQLQNCHRKNCFEGDAKKDLIQDASDDQARSPSGKKRVLHDVEPLHPHTDDENHQLFLKLLCHRTGVLYKGEHLEIHANVQQASRSIDLTATVTLVYVATRNRKLSRLEATLETDFAALHCECGQNSFTEGLLTVLLDEQATSFEQKIKFELMDVLGQPPSMNVKANLVGEMNEEPMELANFFIRLPLLVTSFLKPLQPTFRFKQEWDSPDLEAAADVHSTADWMRSKDSLAALTLDGTMQLFRLDDNLFGLGATLPAHGCHESQAVLVRMSAFPDGKMVMQARSQERRLADAVAAAILSLFWSHPADL